MLAEKAGLSVRHFQDIETRRRAGIRLETIERIARALHVQVWQLLQPGRFPTPERQRGRTTLRVRR
jgi:DNA-binding Xre family transcriptional regulator